MDTDCTHPIFYDTSYYTKVCSGCGLEVMGGLTIEVAYTENMPLYTGYSRKKRFKNMLLAIIDPTRHCSMDGHTQVLLGDQRFEDIPSMLNALKRTKSKNKQYSSVHLYAIVYVNNHKSPTIPHKKIVADIVGDFSKYEHGYYTHFTNRQFFSYRWLLEKLLIRHNLTMFCCYVKKLQNKKSIASYQEMYDKITNACNVGVTPGMALKYGRPLAGLLGDDRESVSIWSCF